MVIANLRPSWVEVDLAAIQQNVKEQQAQLPAQSRILAVVKANAYGHGAVAVAQALRQVPVAGFCVATLDEALELRAAGITELILVLGVTPVEVAGVAAEHQVSLTVSDAGWLQAYATQIAPLVKSPLAVHVAVDSGMGRLGARTPAELQAMVDCLADSGFVFEGMFTHFATADEADPSYFERQVNHWNQLVASLTEQPPYLHMANSATALWHPETITANTVRMGISMYGLNPSGRGLSLPRPLHPAMSVKTAVSFVKQLHAGESVSYGATYTAAADEWVATLPIGYADGYARGLTGYQVLVNGQRCDILGRICMDQMMIRLPESLPVGTPVTLMGVDGDEQITATDLADQLKTINYEVLTGFASRLPRRYH
ncbi:alanine racemase [Limosilactobacillus equigenerosi]|uniref:Alanine racemase n=1 Tax=Limosilactobacillus equigenerosi DSM 18793 = JCM 14505 TaxID=1423742 RepID=A0A0R1UT43_9LACO|nr:alanine racemase [Limosilactobacillus equigenerosi]KRL94627.1 Alanine racemase [Limosilactobacillus equigenerosi DSM 18793 = JCM 14505]